MPSSLPVIFVRDLTRLLTLPVGQLVTASQSGTPIYGFLIVRVVTEHGALALVSVSRSGVALDVGSDGRIVPAQRKVG